MLESGSIVIGDTNDKIGSLLARDMTYLPYLTTRASSFLTFTLLKVHLEYIWSTRRSH